MAVIDQLVTDRFALYRGDCVETMRGLPGESVGYSVFSPPFADLFTYSADVQDMGNCKGQDDFMRQFGFLVDELIRITMPGRLCAVHCLSLLAAKWKDGEIELKDFDGLVWFRHVVDIPESWRGKDLQLGLSVVHDMDVTWFNGTILGAKQTRGIRNYLIDASLVKPGKNLLVSAIVNTSPQAEPSFFNRAPWINTSRLVRSPDP